MSERITERVLHLFDVALAAVQDGEDDVAQAFVVSAREECDRIDAEVERLRDGRGSELTKRELWLIQQAFSAGVVAAEIQYDINEPPGLGWVAREQSCRAWLEDRVDDQGRTVAQLLHHEAGRRAQIGGDDE